MCVCVCVCVCVCACVYVFICFNRRGFTWLKQNNKCNVRDQASDVVLARACVLFHRAGFFRLQDVCDILEGHESMILCCEDSAGCFCQVPSSPYLKILYFTSKDENSRGHELERKRYDILVTCEKMIHTDIGYESATS